MQLLYSLLAGAGAILILGLVYQILSSRRDRRRFPPPGRIMDAAGIKLHLYSLGEGTPVVLFEAGIAASSISWLPIQRELAKVTRVCTYDRAGFSWSPACSEPRTSERLVQELHSLAANLPRPLVIVGHSFGGLIARLYASRFPQDVAGLVLVDPALLLEWAKPTPDSRAKLQRGVTLSRRGALLARIGVVRIGLQLAARGARRVPKQLAKTGSTAGASTIERLIREVRKLPLEILPVVQAHWCRPESFGSMAEHLAILPAVAAAVETAPPLGDLPLIVISGGHLKSEERAEHEELARSSTRGKHIIATSSGHWVHLDQPEIVIDAVKSLLHYR